MITCARLLIGFQVSRFSEGQAGRRGREKGWPVSYRGRGKKGNLFWRDVFRPQRGFASEAPSSHVGCLDGWSLLAYSPHNRPFFSWKAFVLGLANKGNSKVAVKGMEEASRQVLIKLEVDSPRTWVILVFFWSKFAPH